MEVSYDKETEPLIIILREAAIKESDEVYLGMILDIGYDCGIARFKILSASKVVSKLPEIQAVVGE